MAVPWSVWDPSSRFRTPTGGEAVDQADSRGTPMSKSFQTIVVTKAMGTWILHFINIYGL